MRPQQLAKLARRKRRDDTDLLEPRLRVPCERHLERREVEVPVEPLEHVGTLPRVVDQLVAITRSVLRLQRLACRGRMEERRIDRVVDHDRVAQLDPELSMLGAG